MSLGGSLLWPVVAVLGFVLLTGLVAALGTSSVARYEFERNGAREPQRAPAGRPSPAHPAGRRRPAAPSSEAAAQPAASAVGVTERPAVVPGPAREGWWLVGDDGAPVSGPFADRVDADWAALAGGLDAIAAYGVLRVDGRLKPRTAPEERAWLDELGRQLDRLPAEWDELLSDNDPLTTLVVEVAAALVEAGLPLHDGGKGGPGSASGGVCLLPDPDACGVLVSWRSHDRLSVRQARGIAADTAVREVMTAGVVGLLDRLGFVVEPFGATGCHVVTALRG